MVEKDSQSNSQEKQPEQQFNQKQYDLLKLCSDNKDLTKWNTWRSEHEDEKILLQGADLANAELQDANLALSNLQNSNLSGANLQGAWLIGTNLKFCDLRKTNLERADLTGANLEYAMLRAANLRGAKLGMANLQDASLPEANLQSAYVMGGNLQNVNLEEANLQGANLWGVNLQRATLTSANLQAANLRITKLEGAGLMRAKLQGANFSIAMVDGVTAIWKCKVDNETNFIGVGLDGIRIDVETKQLLEYNIRRMNWEEWYEKHPKLKWLVRPFWLMSDYGRSTERIVFTFFGLALVFANIYYHWARLAPPGIVENLFVDRNGVDVQWWLVPLRTLYFSIVTQTTLGFGDMYARAQSICGHILLSLQVILGYVLLGALVTRFAVLFTAGGPAGEFTEKEQKSEQRQ